MKSESKTEKMKRILFKVAILTVLTLCVESSVIKSDDEEIEDSHQTLSEEMQYIMDIIKSLNQTESRRSSKKSNTTKSPQIPPINSDPVQTVSSRIPCNCEFGICSCCMGGFFFNNKGCIKLRYIPEDFAFEVRMTFNERTMYKNFVSGKNPRPICISPPRFDRLVEICAKFHDIYFIGRNMHICLDLAASIGDYDLFDR